MSTTSSQSSSETPQVESSYQNTSSKPENPSVPAEELITRSSIMSNASNTSIVSAKYILIDNIELTLMKQYPTNLGNMIRNILSALNLFPTFINNPTIEQTIMDQKVVLQSSVSNTCTMLFTLDTEYPTNNCYRFASTTALQRDSSNIAMLYQGIQYHAVSHLNNFEGFENPKVLLAFRGFPMDFANHVCQKLTEKYGYANNVDTRVIIVNNSNPYSGKTAPTISKEPTVIVVTKHDESTTFINQWYKTKVNHDFAYNTTSISTTHIIKGVPLEVASQIHNFHGHRLMTQSQFHSIEIRNVNNLFLYQPLLIMLLKYFP